MPRGRFNSGRHARSGSRSAKRYRQRRVTVEPELAQQDGGGHLGRLRLQIWHADLVTLYEARAISIRPARPERISFSQAVSPAPWHCRTRAGAAGLGRSPWTPAFADLACGPGDLVCRAGDLTPAAAPGADLVQQSGIASAVAL